MIPNRALIVGVGATGLSCLRYLHGKTELFVTDTRYGSNQDIDQSIDRLRQEFVDVSSVRPEEVEHVLNRETVVYASPGIPLRDELLQLIATSHSQLACDIDLFLSEIDKPVIGITGTNGKSTTTALVARMLEEQGFIACGNIGTPALDLVESEAGGFVLELSSFQLEKMQPPELDAATILNIAEDHLDHHQTFAAYVAAKQRIYDNCKVAVFDDNDSTTAPNSCSKTIAVNGTEDWCVRDNEVVLNGEAIATEALSLFGRFNQQNIVVAGALAHSCGADQSALVNAACTQTALPHRLEFVRELGGVRYINDSKATNVAATCAALSGLAVDEPNVLLIAGGQGKGQAFEPLAEPVKRFVKALVLFGEDAKLIGRITSGLVDQRCADSMFDAVRIAASMACSGDTVLLSPACASFDMFADYRQRGQMFRKAVERLAL